jgi:hypothetical protein
MKLRHLCTGVIIVAIMLLPCGRVWAAFGEDIERPQPKFTEDSGDWTAELIPRGKSSSIKIRFHVEGGTLAEPAPKVFTDADMPKIDLKNYRSGFFVLDVIPSTSGGEVKISIASSYFNSATDIWGVTERGSRTWGSTQPVNTGGKDIENSLSFTVRDGSVLDEDGVANGHIQVVIGPRDHFWGYALGTLLIRFFGVFLVLGVLEIGMLISGKIFQSMDKKASQASGQPVELLPDQLADGDETPVELPSAVAAAIAIALHLHSQSGQTMSLADSQTGSSSTWSEFGRSQCMADRMSAFDRIQRK